MTFADIALFLLRLVNGLIDWGRKRGLVQGVEEEIARQTAEILHKTGVAKKVMEEINALDSVQVDALLRDLEPK